MATPPEQLERELATRPERVVVVAGIGVSLATCGGHRCASWKGLLADGLRRCEEVAGTAPSMLGNWRAIADDPAATTHALIGVGQFITDELTRNRPGAFAGWLADSIGGITATDMKLVRSLASLGVKLATTNYDNMIEAGTGHTPITWRDRARATLFFREPSRDVLHLHGHYLQPDSVVLGARSYGEICRDEFAQTALRGLMMNGTLVFVGCGAGLEDPNFGLLLDWSRTVLAQCLHSHFVLVRTGEVEDWRNRLRGMPIEPVPYGAEYRELTPYIASLADRVQPGRDREPLALLSLAQTDFEASWAELDRNRGDMDVADYFRRSRLLAAELWRAGGHRRAAMAFSGRLGSRGQGLLVQDYVEFALDAAEWLLDDDLPSMAANHLHEIGERIGAADIPAEHHRRFRKLRVRCMDALCAYKEVLTAIDDALAHASPEEGDRLKAERAEIHFLQGEFTEAARDPE